MHTCQTRDSIEVVDVCTPDTGPPVPATWSNPQPVSLTITGYDENAFQTVPACGAGSAVATFNGVLPVRATISAATLVWSTAGSTFFVFQPEFVQSQSALIFVQFLAGTQWKLLIRCEASLQEIWQGTKTVGLDPIGTYMRVPQAGSAALPLCLRVAET